MLMSVMESVRQAPAYPELAGKRVLVTGITTSFGIDFVRAFADHRTRLILQFAEESEPARAIAEVAAPAALDVRAFGPVERSAEAAGQFARAAVRAFNGLDVAINLVPLSLPRLPGAAASTGDVEQMVAAHLLPAALTSRIAANRMGLVWRDGLVLNVAALPPPVPGRAVAIAALIKAALAHMTRVEAEAWAKHAVRCNAITQQGALLDGRFAGEPEMAALALYLASDRGKGLSGHVFEAEPACPAAASEHN
jgi:NAD(P)-dependent dehydrogenase (short-subunit alcohol dehydrogenase family)